MHLKEQNRTLIATLLGALVLSAQAQPSAQSTVAKSHSRSKPARGSRAASRLKVAEGRYEVVETGSGQNSYREPWILYKTPIGYELQEQWLLTPPKAAPSSVNVGINFAAGLYPIQVRIGDPSGPKGILCSMAVKEFKCESQGKEAKLEMHGAYNAFLPSPWMLGSISRRAKKVPNQSTAVQLVIMGGSDEQGPKLIAFQAEIQYVGEDEVSIGVEKIAASIYELKAINTGIPNVSIPGTLIWTSNEGVVLALQDSTKADQRIELVEYKRYGKF